jgi:hypothetical protein
MMLVKMREARARMAQQPPPAAEAAPAPSIKSTTMRARTSVSGPAGAAEAGAEARPKVDDGSMPGSPPVDNTTYTMTTPDGRQFQIAPGEGKAATNKVQQEMGQRIMSMANTTMGTDPFKSQSLRTLARGTAAGVFPADKADEYAFRLLHEDNAVAIKQIGLEIAKVMADKRGTTTPHQGNQEQASWFRIFQTEVERIKGESGLLNDLATHRRMQQAMVGAKANALSQHATLFELAKAANGSSQSLSNRDVEAFSGNSAGLFGRLQTAYQKLLDSKLGAEEEAQLIAEVQRLFADSETRIAAGRRNYAQYFGDPNNLILKNLGAGQIAATQRRLFGEDTPAAGGSALQDAEGLQ